PGRGLASPARPPTWVWRARRICSRLCAVLWHVRPIICAILCPVGRLLRGELLTALVIPGVRCAVRELWLWLRSAEPRSVAGRRRTFGIHSHIQRALKGD